jgi:hypothetical protein
MENIAVEDPNRLATYRRATCAAALEHPRRNHMRAPTPPTKRDRVVRAMQHSQLPPRRRTSRRQTLSLQSRTERCGWAPSDAARLHAERCLRRPAPWSLGVCVFFLFPRSLIQMATGSGKTFTSVVALYRLIRFAGASMRTSMSLLERREFAARQPGPRGGR